MRLFEAQVEESHSEVAELRQRIRNYEDEIERWAQQDSENNVRIAELQEDRDQWKIIAQQKAQAITELEEERQLLLATIERATDTTEQISIVDPVNHPAHYTAGKVECIDAIDSAVLGLPGPQAYATGEAIKYLWRYSRKNGVEDLRKAAWYIDRLIIELERSAEGVEYAK